MKTKELIYGGIITVVGTVAATLFTDYLKDKPILTTIGICLEWIWVNILNFQVAIWQLFILGVIAWLIYFIINAVKGKMTNERPRINPYAAYTKDHIHGNDWKWNWVYNEQEKKWVIKDLKSICLKCRTPMLYKPFVQSAQCPRCTNYYNKMQSLNVIEAVIIDTVTRDFDFIE